MESMGELTKPLSSSPNIDTHTREGLQRHAVRAHESAADPVQYYITLQKRCNDSEKRVGTRTPLQITRIEDDEIAMRWHNTIPKLVCDIWDVAFEGKKISASYLRDGEFVRLWDDVPYVIGRQRHKDMVLRDAQALARAIDAAADRLEDMIRSKLRVVNEQVIQAIGTRALAVERIWTFYSKDCHFVKDVYQHPWAARMQRISQMKSYEEFLTSGAVHERNEQRTRISLMSITPTTSESSQSLAGRYHLLALVTGLGMIPCAAIAIRSSRDTGEVTTSGDEDFWWLVCSCLGQVTSLLTLVLPLWRPILRSRRLSARALVIFIAFTLVLAVIPIPTYLYMTKSVSCLVGLAANVGLIGLQVQVSLTALEITRVKEKGS